MTARRLHHRAGLAAIAVAGGLAAGPVAAEEPVPFPVAAGTCRLLPVGYVDLEPNCRPRGRPRIVVERPPRLGALLVDQKRLRFTTPKPGLAPCVGRKVPNTVLYYQAARGSLGFDDLTFVVIGRDGPSQRVTWRIEVVPPVPGTPSCRG